MQATRYGKKMRLLADVNIENQAVVQLRTAGHDVLWALESSPTTSDVNLLRQATQGRRTLLTYDRGFGEIVVRERIPAPYGVVLFRLPDEVQGDPRSNFIFGASTIWEQWPPGIWTIRVGHNRG